MGERKLCGEGEIEMPSQLLHPLCESGTMQPGHSFPGSKLLGTGEGAKVEDGSK